VTSPLGAGFKSQRPHHNTSSTFLGCFTCAFDQDPRVSDADKDLPVLAGMIWFSSLSLLRFLSMFCLSLILTKLAVWFSIWLGLGHVYGELCSLALSARFSDGPAVNFAYSFYHE